MSLDKLTAMRRSTVVIISGLFVLGTNIATMVGVRIWLHRRHEAAIIRAKSQELQRFLSKLDHELKNPITALRFGLANLTAITTDPNQLTVVHNLEAQTLRIAHLITNLRKLIEFDRVAIEYIPFALSELMDEAAQLVEATPHAYDRRIRIDIDPPDLTICGDKYLLLIAVYNVLDNAFKFTEGSVSASVWEENEEAFIEIKDSGPGIAEEDLPHVWEELFRAQRTHHVLGSGLGLAMVRAIIERHGGYAEIDSDVENGTRVRLVLPAVRDCEG